MGKEDSSNMLSIGLESLNKLFLRSLGLMLCREMGYFGDWIIADIETGACASWQDISKKVLGGKDSPWWLMRFHDCNNVVQRIVKQLLSIETFKVVRPIGTIGDRYKPGKCMERIELKNPLFKAKSIEEAIVRLDLMAQHGEISFRHIIGKSICPRKILIEMDLRRNGLK